jgi:hypothetical protein
VGNNGETLVADSSTSTGLRYQSAYNGNGVINGAFDIWQRGTSFASATLNGYCADRWKYVRAANVAGITISQVASPQTGFQYGIKQQRTASNTSTDATYLAYGIETKDFLRFAGQTVTLSFYGVKGANFSGVLSLYFAVGTGTDENPLAALTGESILYNSSVSLTTTVARYSVTFAVPSNATDDRFYFSWAPTGTAGADDSFTITGVQLELGSVATTFKRAGGETIQGELAACQRYYYRFGGDQTTQPYGIGYGTSATTALITIYNPVPMRVAAALADYNLLWVVDHATTTVVSSMSIPTNWSGKNCTAVNAVVASGLTTNRPYNLIAQGSIASYIGFSAEL